MIRLFLAYPNILSFYPIYVIIIPNTYYFFVLQKLKKLFGRTTVAADTVRSSAQTEVQEEKMAPPDPEIEQIEAEMRTRFLGCMIGLAIGDAKGMPAESKSVEYGEYVANTFDYLRGYLPAGHFTDDTHHATFLAESLLEMKNFDAKDFLDKLSHMDMNRGYGPTTLQAILRYVGGMPAGEAGLESPGNGPSMRIAPLALLYHFDTDLMRKFVKESANTTHTMPEAIGGALAVSFSVAYMLNHYGEKLDKAKFLKELIDFVRPESPELADALKDDADLMERQGCRVLESVPHAIKAFLSDPYDFEKAVSQAIRGGGDADTIAAIVGAISGAFNGLDKIPQQWIERLENSPKGRDYLRKIALELYELSKQKKNSGSSN